MRNTSRHQLLFAMAALGCLAGCSSGSSLNGSGGGGVAPATPYIYASDGLSSDTAIYSYPLSSTGSGVVPTATVNLASSLIIMGIKSNGSNVFVLGRTGYSDITVFVYTASKGVLTQVRSFSASFGAGVAEVSGGFAVDAAGKVYVGLDNFTVAIFGAS